MFDYVLDYFHLDLWFMIRVLESANILPSSSRMQFTPEGSSTIDWVNLSKRGGKDGVFRGLAGPEENPILPDSFTQIYILFPTRFLKVLRSAGE